MEKFYDKAVTCFFVVILGAIWYLSTKCHVVQNYNITVYDMLGKQIIIDGLRTNFKNQRVARSYILEYQERFSQYEFFISSNSDTNKEKFIPRLLKNFHK